MKLEELKKKLYRPEAEFEERLEGPEVFRSGETREKIKIKEWQAAEKKRMSPEQKKKLKIIGISAGVIFLIVIGFLFWRGLTSFDTEEVRLEINGPEKVVSGEEIEYTVKYQNNTRLALEGIKLIFHFPENSIPSQGDNLVQTIDLPNLGSGQKQETKLLARIIGLKGEEKKAWVELSYQLADLSSRYSNKTEFSSQIISVPLVLDFDLPEQLVNGQSFDFSLRYLNQAQVSFDNLRVKIEYPSGFVFESASPEALENDKVWSLDNLMAGEQGKIFIRGRIEGEEDEAKSFKAQLGLWQDSGFSLVTETASALRISSSPLLVSQKVNNSTSYSAQVGEQLKYQIDYENTTDIGINNVIIISQLESRALDLTSLELGQASFDGTSQTLTWNASNLTALKYLGPHQKGQISFSVKIKNSLSVNSYNDKNFEVINTVKIDSSEKPLALEEIEIAGESQSITKIISPLSLQAKGYYYDDLISNSGPVPPKVGQTTTYTIKWQLVNVSNDLSNVKVQASLPPHAKWMNKVSPVSADLNYNSQTGQLIWQIGNLSAATGVLLPVKEVAFQVAITPSLAHLGSAMELIGQSQITGQDDFVGLELSKTDSLIDTRLPDDPLIDSNQGQVIE
ncbi:MAG: isopeptide-forming domain-containing fimbrial protein [Patescibacteria group bacterium]